jgi:O-antigen/teichoic acid export membrane protein
MTRLAAVRRVSWGFGDQALSSLVNFGVGVLVARTVGADEFGAFSLAFVTYTVALITSRALASEPFLIRHSATGEAAWRTAARGSSGIALSVAVLAGLIVAAIGLIIDGAVGRAFLALSICLPGLLSQDMWRFAYIARGRAHWAFIVDLAWLTLLVPGLLALGAIGSETIVLPILVWGGSATIVALGSHIGSRIVPSVREATGWWRRHRDIGPRYVLEALISMGATQASVYALVTFAGLAAAGALRGGQILLGPMQVLLMGVGITAVPEGVRMVNRGGPGRLHRPAVIVSILVAGSTILWGLIISQLPDAIGVALLGATWASAKGLIVPLAIAYAIGSLALGAGIGLRVLADARRSLRARSADAIAQATGGVLGAYLMGALGTAIGLALGSIVGFTAHWLYFTASLRQRRSGPPDGSGPDAATPGAPDTIATEPIPGRHEETRGRAS